ncbi:MAG: BatD family protein [Sulfuriferula sp.]|nr:BatD family protein [Sulfuriferula sp.]
MKNACLIIIALLFAGLSLSANAAVTASLDRTQTGAGEAVQLTLQYDGQTDKQPDLSALKQDFDILGRSTGTSIQVINGKMSAQTQLSLTLMPKHGGRITIPPVSWNGQSSAALTLTVGGNAAQPGNTAGNGNSTPANTAHAFITASLDQKQPYVQAAAMLTVRLYVDEPLYQATLELQPNNDVLIQQLGKDTQTSTTYRGRDYQVVERKYLLFPQRSGVIQLSGPVLNAQIADASNSSDPFGNDPFFANAFGHNPFGNMINATRPIRIQGEQITLNVRPRPAGSSGQDWLPAQSVNLTETWQPDSGAFHVGDPITRHLHLQAQGLTASQLPDLSKLMTLPDGLRAYPDQAKLNDNVQGGSVLGSRDQDIALIASRAGHYDIPAMHLHWWDTAKNVQRSIDLPARTLDVLPGTTTAAVAPVPPSQQSADATQASGTPLLHMANPLPAAPTGYLWPMTSLGLAVLWLGTVAAWWRSSRRNAAPRPARRQEPPLDAPPDASQSRKAFQHACRENDPQSARRHLQAWARATWPDDPPAGLKAIATRLPERDTDALLQQLDRACYTDHEWHGAAMLAALPSLSAKNGTAARTEPQLNSLYP